jgi:hypothetical protein
MPGGRPDSPGIYLLDLVVGGHVYRYATESVEVTDAAGRTFAYAEGLGEPGLTYGSLFGVSDASVSVEVQAEDVDWALIVQRGHALDRAPAVLRRWYAGRTLDRARVVLRGLVTSPSYGAKGEPLALTITRSMRAQSRTIPPAQAVVDTSTWPVTGGGYVSPDSIQGAAVPLVIGCPGGTEDATPIPVVPVPQAEHPAAFGDGRLVWIGGHAGQVRVQHQNADPAVESDETVATIDDVLGRLVQYAPTNGASFDDEGAYFLGFRDDATYGGGVLHRGELLRGAGSVIEWALTEHYDGPVDHARVRAVRAYLDQWKIDTYLNSPVSAWDWLAKEILPLLPVEMREGPDGVYPALIRYDLSKRDAVAHLDATAGSGRVTRASPVTLTGDIANEVTIEYRPSAETGSKWLARRIITAQAGAVSGDDASDVDDERVIGSYLCAESQRRYGVIPVRIQATAVWDTSTAVLVARHVVARRAWPRRAVRYTGGPWLEDIEIGSAVLLTDPDLHLAEELAVVVDVQPGPESAVDLVVLDHPVERGRATE